MDNPIDEIKSKLDIVDVVSEYIPLKKVGANWKALCPFHSEKTPSFFVSPERQIWHCFGCGAGGDIFGFIMQKEGLEFPEALKLLANKSGVKLKPRDPQLASQRNKLLDICELAAKFWHKILLESSQGKRALKYLTEERGVSLDLIEDFRLGYAPDSWVTTSNFLKSRDFSEQDIFLAGLTVKKERGEDFYDRFRDRIIFPISDLYGNVIGFGARALKKDEEAKYINSPQTLIYNKSLVLYNLDKAKNEIKKKNFVVLVEGYMDVLASFKTEIKNVVSSSGTALTLEQIKLLKRYTNNLVIAFDTDPAGESASQRGIDLALTQGVNIKVIRLPFGKDPDECIKKDSTAWLSAVSNSQSIMEYYFDYVLKKFDLKQLEDKKKVAEILLKAIAKINNVVERNFWLKKLAEILEISEQLLREALPRPRISFQKRETKIEISLTFSEKDRSLLLSQRVLAIILKHPSCLPYVIDHLKPEIVVDKDLNLLYRKLIVYYTENVSDKDKELKELDYNQFKISLSEKKLANLVDTLIFLAEKDFFDFESDLFLDEVKKAIKFLHKNYILNQLRKIEEDFKKAEQRKDKVLIKKLSEQFNELSQQLNLLKD